MLTLRDEKKIIYHFPDALLSLFFLSFSLNRLAIRLKRHLTKLKIASAKLITYFLLVPNT